MSTVLPRAIAVLELLAGEPDGLPLGEIARKLSVPHSAIHRVLSELVELEFLVQRRDDGRYVFGLKVVSLGFRHLANVPLVELARPSLDRLAERSGELVRLSVPENETLRWVAKTQGARSGLRFDSDDGRVVKFARSASGLVWLSTLPEDIAIRLLREQGFDDLEDYGPVGPTCLDEALELVNQARRDGWLYVDSMYELGTSAIAMPIALPDQPAVGVLNIAGPNVRLTREYAQELIPPLREETQKLAQIVPPTSAASIKKEEMA